LEKWALLRAKQVKIVSQDGGEALTDNGGRVAIASQPKKQTKTCFSSTSSSHPLPHLPIQQCPTTTKIQPTPPKQKEKEPVTTPRPLP
jgi:hypothetical protein